ncbi:MAG: hypothetical protein IT326_10345 [Anaerolineae bacterium]|nr:hypothetical protein [Anaerolineae bacterium]
MIIAGFTNIRDGHHDNSVTLVRDGRIIYASTEERFSRTKHDSSVPLQSLTDGLRRCGLTLADIDYFATGWTEAPFTSGLFEPYPIAPLLTGLNLFLRRPLEVLKYARFRLGENLFRAPRANTLVEMGVAPEKIIRLDHYHAHAASAYFTSGLERALAVCVDAMGTDTAGRLWSGGAYWCEDGRVTFLEHVPLHASMGLFYSAVTVMLGFTFNDGEWKTMGLSAYAKGNDACVEAVRRLAPRFEDGRWVTHPGWTDYRIVENAPLLRASASGRALARLVEQYGKEEIARAAQVVFEEEMLAYLRSLIEKTGAKSVVLAGGSFLNVKFNKLLREELNLEHVFVHPHAGDGGIAAGSALLVHAQKDPSTRPYRLQNAALGASFSTEEIEVVLQNRSTEISYERLDDRPGYTASALASGKVIGWFQGAAEWGPRALGQRSVIADPRSLDTKERINSTLKNRDWFMPFAPAVMFEHTAEYFERAYESPFMTLAFDVVPGQEAKIPAAIHIDNTARPQTVRREQNAPYYEVIEAFYKLTGVPVVLNTSFNRHGLPIVNSPDDAVDHLIWSCVDELVIGDFVARRRA